MKVFFVTRRENLPDELLQELSQVAGYSFFETDPADLTKLPALFEAGDKIMAPFPEPLSWKFPNELIPRIPDLKGVCLPCTSFSWIDGKMLRSLGIPLTNDPGSATNAVAEAAVFMILAVAKRFPLIFKQKRFEYIPDNALQEIMGRVLGIVGLGNIGQRTAKLGEALGMNVIYYSRSPKKSPCHRVALEELMQTADFIAVCTALNDGTKNMISRGMIDLMRPSSSLVTIAPPEVVDLDYLVSKVSREEIYGAAFESADKTITDYPGNVFVTRHCNFYTEETIKAKMRYWVDNIIGVIDGKPKNVVN